jgi:hypothetical protein
MRTRKRLTANRILVVAGLGVLALVLSLVASPASAQTIDVPVNDVIVTGEPGTVQEIGGVDVASDLVGRTCDIVATVKNQSSVHLGNTLIVTSGDSTVSVDGIEDVADGTVSEAGSITLGSTITVSVELGQDGVSSLGSNLTVTCEALPEAPPAAPVVTTPTYTG